MKSKDANQSQRVELHVLMDVAMHPTADEQIRKSKLILTIFN